MQSQVSKSALVLPTFCRHGLYLLSYSDDSYRVSDASTRRLAPNPCFCTSTSIGRARISRADKRPSDRTPFRVGFFSTQPNERWRTLSTPNTAMPIGFAVGFLRITRDEYMSKPNTGHISRSANTRYSRPPTSKPQLPTIPKYVASGISARRDRESEAYQSRRLSRTNLERRARP